MVEFHTYPHEDVTFRFKIAATETALDLLSLASYFGLER